MTFAQVFWVLSTVAAGLFFLAGYAAAPRRGRARPAGEPPLERRPPATAPLAPVVPSGASGETVQAMLDRIGGAKGLRAAVLADGMGLPIACVGEHPESLAGFSGFLAQAATRAADFLPIGPIRRIVIEDDRLGTITACNVAGSDILLATLTRGPGPEPGKMVQILDEASSVLGQRRSA